MKCLFKTALAWAVVAATPLFATSAHAALGVCDAAPLDNIEVEATAGTLGPTSYNTLKAAFDAVNAGTHQGAVSIEVCGNTTEAASAVLNASGAGAAIYTAVSIKPVGGVARSISGALAAPLVDLNGADAVTIDGLGTGGNTLTINNTSIAATAGTSTIRFIGGASGNTVTHASILGASLVPFGTAGGTIAFSTDTVAATGNDNNTVSFCDIGPSSAATLPITAVFGLGTTATQANHNSGVVIDSNNIFDFFGTGATFTSAFNILGGNDAWTISNNKIYQTAPRTFTAAARYTGMTINTTVGAFTITGNTIGFGAANGTGTTTISGAANEFRGIEIPNTNITAITSIQGNVISGINQSTSDNGTQTSGPFLGILAGSTDGRFNIGDVTGNRIGSLDGSSTIVINESTTTASLVYGILDFSFRSNTVANNAIGAITIQGTGTVTGFRGIAWNTGSALTETVTNNTIGGSAAGAIVDLQVGNNAVYGIQGQSAAAIVTGNTVTNLSANSISAATPSITAGGLNIASTSTTVASTIARNTVRAISNNAGASTNGGGIYGIVASLPNTLPNLVERNFVDSLTPTSTVTGYQIAGIVASAGTTTYRNNMVSLGLDAAGNPITTGFFVFGLFDPSATGATTSQFYFNTVFVGGAGVTASTSNSFALYSSVVTNVRNFQNNILWNARGNAVAGGSAHIAIRIGATTTGLTSNFNDLFASGTDGAVGAQGATLLATLANWQTATAQDANSVSVNPTLVSASNLHLVAGSPMIGAGTTIASVTNDFDGDARPGANPAIGADEFVAVTHTVTPSVGTPSGSISPSTPQVVTDGATTVFTLTPSAGFHSNTVTGTCGGNLVGNTFTTNAITADCTVIANFAANVVTHTVTPSVGTPSGSITPNTPQVVNDGATTVFTLAANPGFHVNNVTGTCGGNLVANTYTTNAITADCTVIANFAADVVTHTVTPSVGTPSGTITPSTPQVVNDGATTAFTLAANAGFHINNVTGTCGGNLVGTTYTTNAVTADCTVIANFAADVVGTFPPDENFDEVTAPALPGGWVSAHTGLGIDWVTVNTSSDTAPNSAYAAEFNNVADETLTSVTFTPTAGQTLTFRHSYNLEFSTGTPTTAYDGAVLEISISGGAFQDILAAGGSFQTGGYNKTVSNCCLSPILNRQAWSGSSGGFVTAVVVLPPASIGNPTQIRFRTADDSSAVATAPNGWWIDTLHLGVSNPPSATVSPPTLTFSAAVNGTDADTLTINNAAGSAPLTYAIAAHEVLRPVVRPHSTTTSRTLAHTVNQEALLKDRNVQQSVQRATLADGGSIGISQNVAPWIPAGSIVYQVDDGTSEGSVGFGTAGPPATESGAVWINQFAATGAQTIDSISIFWPTQTSGTLVGQNANLVVYYDAGSTGDPTNAVRIGGDNLVAITSVGAFQTYTTSYVLPGAGDVYIGFVDQWALAGGFSPRFFPAAEDRTTDQLASWVSGAGTPPTDIVNLANNSTTGLIGSLQASLAGNWMIRATATSGGGGGPCTGPVVTWLTANPVSGSINGGDHADVTVTANPSAGSLAVGSYTAELCLTTNDPVHALISVPVSLTVTEAPFVLCGAGADEIFCNGFDPAGGTAGQYTDRTTFLTHVAAGFYENPFADAVPGASPPLNYTSGTWAYTVDASSPGPGGGLYNDTGIISTNLAADSIVVTFTGAPVTAVGGNFWATDIAVQPTGSDVTITLSDGTTTTFTSTGPTDFRGFTTVLPITTITIDAPDVDPFWPTMDNLIIGIGN